MKLSINDTIFINISKSTGQIESVNKLTAFETRSLAQGKANLVPFTREEQTDFAPRTDLHTHYAGALRTESLIRVGREHDITYPSSWLEKMGIDISGYSIEEDGNIKINDLSDEDIGVLEDNLKMTELTQETFNKMEEVYALRKPFTKKVALFPEWLRELANDYKEAGIEYAELSMSNFMTQPEYMQAIEECLPQIEQETGVKIRFLAALSRHSDKEWNLDEADRIKTIAKSPYIVGMDVMGHETNETNVFGEELQTLARYAMQEDPEFAIRVHAGENPIFDKNVRDTLQIIYDEHSKLEAETGNQYPMPVVRIGHGLYGVNEEVLSLAKEMGAIIEFNMSSNLALNNIDSIEQIPIKDYIDNGIDVVLGTDGHGMYSTSSRQEVLLAIGAGLKAEDFEKIKDTEGRILENARRREEKHPRIDDVPELYSQMTFSTESGEPHYTKEVEERYSRQKQEALETLKEKMESIGAIVDEDSIQEATEGKIPIVLTGASKDNWSNITPEDQEKISLTMQVLADTLDPETAFIITGGTNYGVEKTMHEAVHRRNLNRDDQLVLLGTLTMEATHDDFGGLEKDTITHATILENEGRVASNWHELPDTQLEYARERGGSVIAVGGGNIVTNMIQRAHNIGDIDMQLMDGPYGASTTKSRSLEGNGYSFKSIEELLQRLYERNPRMFVKDFSLDRIDEYIMQAQVEIGIVDNRDNPANFGLGAIAEIDEGITPTEREAGVTGLKQAMREERANGKDNKNNGEQGDDGNR